MRLASYEQGGSTGFGRLEADRIVPLHSPAVPDLKSWLGQRSLAATGPALPLEAVRLLPPVPQPGKILCVATNFIEPGQEDRPRPGYPLLFSRFADTVVGHGAALEMPVDSAQFDYEGELAVIIGKPGRHIAESEALEHVAGYTCFNDGTARDWQKHSSQFTAGKNFYHSGSLGPWMVCRDALPDLAQLQLQTRVNGVQTQAIGLDRMIFGLPWLIAYVSRFTPLAPGDVIATGTPTGFGSSRVPPQFLAEGDVIEVEISGLGILRNTVRRAVPA